MRDALHMAQPAPMLQPHAARPLIALVFEGLSEQPKQLPSTLYFDALGSGIYDALRAQAEHYPARIEDDLLRRHAGEIATLAGARAALVDYGAGDGRQARRHAELNARPAGVRPARCGGFAVALRARAHAYFSCPSARVPAMPGSARLRDAAVGGRSRVTQSGLARGPAVRQLPPAPGSGRIELDPRDAGTTGRPRRRGGPVPRARYDTARLRGRGRTRELTQPQRTRAPEPRTGCHV